MLKYLCLCSTYTLSRNVRQKLRRLVKTTNLGDVFTIAQSMMTFLIMTDVFYERIIQHKLVPRMNPNISLRGLDRGHIHKLGCEECLHRNQVSKLQPAGSIQVETSKAVKTAPKLVQGRR